MNDWRIEIITASNQEQYLAECIKYVNALRIPEGYEVSFTNVKNAVSMTAAYNEAMHSSDAKYKVYIHQDTFLIYADLLNALLNVFKENPDIGMIGVLGGKNLDRGGNAWNAWNCGRTRAWNTAEQLEINFQTESAEMMIVDAIDGMFMATQYDIEWREDVIRGWDFYDLSQSCEFMKRGYRVAVPYQQDVWCLHDCGHSKLRDYEAARKCFCEVYHEFGYRYCEPETVNSLQERYTLLESVTNLIRKLISQEEYSVAELMLQKADNLQIRMTELSVLRQIFEIRKWERAEGKECFTANCNDYEMLLAKYTDLKFQLRRVEYDMERETVLTESLRDGKISWRGLDDMIEHCVYDRMKVRRRLGMR